MDVVKLYLYYRYKLLKYTESYMSSKLSVIMSSLSVLAVAVGVFELLVVLLCVVLVALVLFT